MENRNQKDRGFTLIELLVGVAIVALIAIIAVPKVLAAYQDSKVKLANDVLLQTVKSKSMADAAGVVFPAAEIGAADCSAATFDPVWDLLIPDYLSTKPGLDPWGNPYQCVLESASAGGAFIVSTKGANGTAEEGVDINDPANRGKLTDLNADAVATSDGPALIRYY